MVTPLCRASIVIPTYQRRASLLRTLQALAQQTLPPHDYEVIVCIDGSEDGTREMMADFPAPYQLRAVWQTNKGRAAACNAGIRMATGKLLILLDDDMEPAPGFVAAHLRVHSGELGLGVLGAVPISLDPPLTPVVRYISSKFNRHLEKLAQPGYAIRFRDFYSGNFSIDRDVLLPVGAFDEDFKIYGNEDGELALRLLKAGVKLVYSPEASACQHYEKDFAALARDNVAKGRTAVLFANKYPDTFHELKLGTYRQESRKKRFLRASLLGFSRLWTGTPDRVVYFIAWLEQRRSNRLYIYYSLALDYFYWLGADSALREGHNAGSRPNSFMKSFVSLKSDSNRTLFY